MKLVDMTVQMRKLLFSTFTAAWFVLVLLSLALQRPIKAARITHALDADSIHIKNPLSGQHNIQLARTYVSEKQAYNAFFMSEFDYWDARILADYWGVSLDRSKLDIGRKLVFSQRDGTLPLAKRNLYHYLYRAQSQYLRTVRPNNVSTYRLYLESYTYDDAVLLAKLWHNGRPSPNQIFQAKYEIDQSLAYGNNELIQQSLQRAKRLYSN